MSLLLTGNKFSTHFVIFNAEEFQNQTYYLFVWVLIWQDIAFINLDVIASCMNVFV